jgi:N-formylglutamate deformylase
MDESFPIVRRPARDRHAAILVSVPHYGTQPMPRITLSDYREPSFATFAYRFADAFASDLYGALHEHGATVLATPVSRMFVDVNRRRDDVEHRDGEMWSKRGVVRTHTMRETPIFARPLTPANLEARLIAFYDPYYATLEHLLGELRQAHGHAILLDGHTGSPRRMKDRQVIIGTCHATTCEHTLATAVARVFARHSFDVHDNVSGYTGGNIVATFGRPQARVHALQLEINASLVMTTSADEYIAQVRRGETPPNNEANVARLRACLHDVVTTLPTVFRP